MVLRLTMLFSMTCLFLALSGCKYTEPELFTEPVAVVGGELSADVLNKGQEAYILYCYACHGMNGDGRGPASSGLRPPPRDFRLAKFKFGGVKDGLPHDDDLLRLVQNGLHGTAMLPWVDVPEIALRNILQFIKTLSADEMGWRDEDEDELGERVEVGVDPWSDPSRSGEAIKRGEALYHGFTQCHSCHPAYVEWSRIDAYSKQYDKIASPRENLYFPVAKVTESYSAQIPGHPVSSCETDEDCARKLRIHGDEGRWSCVDGTCNECEDSSECGGTDQVCRFGICEQSLKIMPPDFETMPLRSIQKGSELKDLYTVITAGVPGTAMTAWYSLPEEERWALAYYIDFLTKRTGLSASELAKDKARLKASVP